MLNLIQKFFNRDSSNKAQLRKVFSQHFFSQLEHKWICDGKLQVHFEALISRLPVGVLDALMGKYPTVFIRSQDMGLQRDPTRVQNSIVIFPEFQKLIASQNEAAVAYLAHELAFVLYELEEARIDPLMAEVEADKFVCDLGLTFELESLLLMLDETIEKRLRLTYLTVNHFTRNQDN